MENVCSNHNTLILTKDSFEKTYTVQSEKGDIYDLEIIFDDLNCEKYDFKKLYANHRKYGCNAFGFEFEHTDLRCFFIEINKIASMEFNDVIYTNTEKFVLFDSFYAQLPFEFGLAGDGL